MGFCLDGYWGAEISHIFFGVHGSILKVLVFIEKFCVGFVKFQYVVKN